MSEDDLQVQVVADRKQRAGVLALTVIAVGFALYFMRPVLLPLLFALFLYLCLTPLIDFQLQRLRLPYALTVAHVFSGERKWAADFRRYTHPVITDSYEPLSASLNSRANYTSHRNV